jgi:hypothetical protein
MKYIVAFLLASASLLAFAQQDPRTFSFEQGKSYILTLKDKSQVVGEFLEKDERNVVLKTALISRMEIPYDNIVSVKPLDSREVRDGEYWFPNMSASKYVVTPSAYSLEKGEWHYRNHYLFVNSFQGGITDNFSVGLGIEFLSTFGSLAAGAFEPVFFVTGKYSIEVAEKLNIGIGINHINSPGFPGRVGINLPFVVTTLGTREHNVSLNFGMPVIDGYADSPLIILSGTTRISKRTSLITENWLIAGEDMLFSYGFRFLGEKTAIDLAFINNGAIAETLVIGIPFVGFSVRI